MRMVFKDAGSGLRRRLIPWRYRVLDWLDHVRGVLLLVLLLVVLGLVLIGHCGQISSGQGYVPFQKIRQLLAFDHRRLTR